MDLDPDSEGQRWLDSMNATRRMRLMLIAILAANIITCVAVIVNLIGAL